MVKFESASAEFLVYTLMAVAGVILLWLGYRIGRLMATSRFQREIAKSQSDLFTTQQGFKKLYETEIATLKHQNETLKAEATALNHRVEEYRKKAAGFGGLFSSGSKKSDAMYALLLENEALEEALHKQNQKLNTERTDAVQESLRNIGYRRVLMSQLLNDNRIKDYVREILEDEHRLPLAHQQEQPKLSVDTPPSA
jgi:predicted lactoylglutathione lyase